MEKFTGDLLAQMHLELQKIELETDNALQRAQQSFNAVESALKSLKKFILSYEFKDDLEEVRFFKELKPMFLKELVYFSELYYIEANKPIGKHEVRQQYYTTILDSMGNYFEKNRYLYNYYKTGGTELDGIYFLRKTIIVPMQPVYTQDMDTNFSTPYSSVLAHLQAYDELSKYLVNAIAGKEEARLEKEQKQEGSNATWVATQVGFAEVFIALYYAGAIRFGKGGSLKEFIAEMARLFNVRMGNIYRIYLGFTYRKKGKTPYLQSLIDTMERKYDEKDML